MIADITYGPLHPVNDSRRRTQQLIIDGRRACGGISRWMTTISLTAFLRKEREPAEEYAIARLNVVPAARGAEALRRRKGRYRKQRRSSLGELQQQNPYPQRPTWEELRTEVKAFREHISYDSGQ